MNKILEIAFSGFWQFIGITILLHIIFKPINLYIRYLNIRYLNIGENEWPPHLDSDGDPITKENNAEKQKPTPYISRNNKAGKLKDNVYFESRIDEITICGTIQFIKNDIYVVSLIFNHADSKCSHFDYTLKLGSEMILNLSDIVSDSKLKNLKLFFQSPELLILIVYDNNNRKIIDEISLTNTDDTQCHNHTFQS